LAVSTIIYFDIVFVLIVIGRPRELVHHEAILTGKCHTSKIEKGPWALFYKYRNSKVNASN
jgi:hypothetical protein